jgi:hypothetical protein
MFVLASKYERVLLCNVELKLDVVLRDRLIDEQNKLIARQRAEIARLQSSPVTALAQLLTFDKDEIKSMIALCHPDRHGGKESAVRITQKLLKLKDAQ